MLAFVPNTRAIVLESSSKGYCTLVKEINKIIYNIVVHVICTNISKETTETSTAKINFIS